MPTSPPSLTDRHSDDHPPNSAERWLASPVNRLPAALLGYLGVITLVVTWAPFQFRVPEVAEFSLLVDPRDVIMNVIMFLPLGFFAQASRRRGHPPGSVPLRRVRGEGGGGSAGGGAQGGRVWPVFLAGAAFSTTIEVGQLFLAERFSSPVDILTNGVGAALGAWLFNGVRARLRLNPDDPRVLALDLPLTGLLLLQIPLLWVTGFAGAGTPRAWLLVGLAVVWGGLLGAVHGGHLPRGRHLPGRTLPFVAGGTFALFSLPGAVFTPLVLAVGVLASGGAAEVARRLTLVRRIRERDRRVEIPTLRTILPLLALYLVAVAFWPTGAPGLSGWTGGWSLAPGNGPADLRLLMATLEFLGAFTVLGYAGAELRGRSGVGDLRSVAAVGCVAAMLSVLLMAGRGFVTGLGASYSVMLLAVAAAVFGGWLYGVQRDSIRALLGRDGGAAGPESGAARCHSEAAGMPDRALPPAEATDK